MWIFWASLREINVLLFLSLSSAPDKAAASVQIHITPVLSSVLLHVLNNMRIYTTERNKSS